MKKIIAEKTRKAIQKYVDKYVEVFEDSKKPDHILKELRSHSKLDKFGINAYINPSDINDVYKYSGGYAQIRFLGIEVSHDGGVTVQFTDGNISAIDMNKWFDVLHKVLDGERLTKNFELSDFYSGEKTIADEYIKEETAKKTDTDELAKAKAEILDNLLSRKELVIKG